MRSDFSAIALHAVNTTPLPLLKLHTEERPLVDRPELSGYQGFAQLCRAFAESTGWHMECTANEPAAVASPRKATKSRAKKIEVDLNTTAGAGKLVFTPAKSAAKPSLVLEQVQPLAGAVAEVLGELQRTRVALWQREAELAAGVPLIPHAAEGERLAARLEATIRSGAQALDCQAAALYMLDDSTSNLKLRSAWHLPPERYLDAPRPLRGAVADLEALTGHAVAIEDTQFLPHWRVPEPHFPAAVCVPVSSPTTPLGTLWAFGTSPRAFTDRDTGLWEIVAGRIAADLEREVLLQEAVRGRAQQRALADLAQWQQDRRPQAAPLLDEYEFAAIGPHGANVAASFFDWQVLRDGAVALAAGSVHAAGKNAAPGAAQLLATCRAHASHQHTATELLGRVNESLWLASPGDERASLAYLRVDPETGLAEAAAAGNVFLGLARHGAVEWLGGDTAPLATAPELKTAHVTRSLAVGETLVLGALAAAPQGANKSHAVSGKRVLQQLAGERLGRAEHVVSAVRRQLDAIDAAATADAALVAIKRRA